jgi:hypothetical protein
MKPLSVVADSGNILKIYHTSEHTTLSRDGKLRLSNAYQTQVPCYWKGAARLDAIRALPPPTGASEPLPGGFGGVLVTKIVGLAGVRDGNSITLWGTNNLSGEVTYSCLSVSRLVLSSPRVIWHGASSRWRGVQLEPSVAFFTPESVLLTIHHTLVAPHLPYMSHPIYHSPYTCRTPSTIHHTLVAHLPSTIHHTYTCRTPSTIHHTLVAPSTIRHTLVAPHLPFTIHSSRPIYRRYCNNGYQYESSGKPVLTIAMHTMWKADPQLHWSCSTLSKRSPRGV